MIEIALPDGSVRQFDAAITGDELAADISKSLAKKAVLLRLDGELKDLSTRIDRNCAVEIITRDHPAALETLRHDAAHVLAEAVKELYPETQITIGPVIENGFYYDFARPEPFSLDDLEVIEKRMCEIVDRDEPIVREVWDRDEAVAFFRAIGEEYKAEIIASIPQGEDVGLYRQGDWQDLCRGPHLPSTGKLGKAFKLTKLAGAYWRGDSDNEMLQRIYGTCWASDKELKAYLHMLEEAEKRDHRRLGKIMDLFHFQEESPGAVFWHPKGWSLFQSLIGYMRQRNTDAGYQEINTPELMSRSLWETSGHWDSFGDNMFTTETVDASKLVNLGGSARERNDYWGFTPREMPLNARVWYPDGEGPFPLVLVVHGNHNMRDFSDPGYDYLGELLASRGYILASVDENFINGGIRGENDARGWFLLKHVELFEGFNEEDGNPFEGLVDMDNVVLIGH